MLLKWMQRRGVEPQDLRRLGVATLLVALGFVTLGSRMNRAFDRGADTFAGIPLTEALCVAVLAVGSVLMGMSIVFNVTGIVSSRHRG